MLWRQVHLTLAITYMLPGDETVSVVKRLVDRLHARTATRSATLRFFLLGLGLLLLNNWVYLRWLATRLIASSMAR